MRKIISLLLLLFFSILMWGCNYEKRSENDNKDDNKNGEEEKPIESEMKSGKIGVVYFSVTGNTKKVAEYIANYYEAKTIEIIPLEEYTSNDINYSDSSSRTSLEQNDSNARPKIKNKIDIAEYEYLFLGYPIWWGQAPKILYSFVESVDLKGKTVIPFCTSGSSSIGSSAINLSKASEGNWLDGIRVSGNGYEKEISSWLEKLNIIKDEEKEMNIILHVDGKKVDVEWYNNESVLDLKEKLSNGKVEISTHNYGDFEQVGPLGFTLKSNDERVDTKCGDIVLYTSSNICLYYNKNSWSFTRLGKIINMTEGEIKEMLSKENATIILSLE